MNKPECESLNDNEMNKPNIDMKIFFKKIKYIKILKKDMNLYKIGLSPLSELIFQREREREREREI